MHTSNPGIQEAEEGVSMSLKPTWPSEKNPISNSKSPVKHAKASGS